jgi:hypothetical protein
MPLSSLVNLIVSSPFSAILFIKYSHGRRLTHTRPSGLHQELMVV